MADQSLQKENKKVIHRARAPDKRKDHCRSDKVYSLLSHSDSALSRAGPPHFIVAVSKLRPFILPIRYCGRQKNLNFRKTTGVKLRNTDRKADGHSSLTFKEIVIVYKL